MILLSDDAGAHWRPASTAPDHASTLTQVRFITPTLGIAVGHDGRIVRSDDAGLHWRDVHMDHAHADPLLSVWARPAAAVRGRQLRPAAALGRRGPHLADRENPAGDRHLNAIVGDGHGNLLVAGESGTLLRSTDNGATWDKLPSPPPARCSAR